SGNIYPNRLTLTGLRPTRLERSYNRPFVLFMDADNLWDIIDYWNLRACGCHILPVAQQAKDLTGLQTDTLSFIEGHTNRYETTRFYGDLPEFQCSRFCDPKKALSFLTQIRSSRPPTGLDLSISVHRLFPRYWNLDSNNNDHVSPAQFE